MRRLDLALPLRAFLRSPVVINSSAMNRIASVCGGTPDAGRNSVSNSGHNSFFNSNSMPPHNSFSNCRQRHVKTTKTTICFGARWDRSNRLRINELRWNCEIGARDRMLSFVVIQARSLPWWRCVVRPCWRCGLLFREAIAKMTSHRIPRLSRLPSAKKGLSMRFTAAALLLALFPFLAQAGDLELKKGDHICIVGNTLADRMQHYGWLETFIQARFPEHQLVFRNLGYSGDELDLSKRLRSAHFGTPDQWLSGSAPPAHPVTGADPNRFELTSTNADVIFAFFGYNESFAGEAGLPKFKQELEGFIKHTLSQKYNGKSAPRLVLCSPIAHEDL